MDTQPAFGFKEVLTQMVGEVAKAVSERAGETPPRHRPHPGGGQRRSWRSCRAMRLRPMLAGRCLMFHELTIDGVAGALGGKPDAERRAAGNAVVALDRAFRANLGRLRDYQKRPDEGRRTHPRPSRRRS